MAELCNSNINTRKVNQEAIPSHIQNSSGPEDPHFLHKEVHISSNFPLFTLNPMFTFTSVYVFIAKNFEMCARFKFVLMISLKVQYYLNLTGELLQHMVFFKWRHKCAWNICSCALIFTLAWYFLNMPFMGDSIHSPESEHKAWMHVAQTPECLLRRAELTPITAREWSYCFPLLYVATTANHRVCDWSPVGRWAA